MEEVKKTVVIDLGSGLTKVGFAGEGSPRSTFPTVIGYPKYARLPSEEAVEYYVGDEVMAIKGMLKLSYMIRRGVVKNWDQLERLLEYIFHTVLAVRPEECAVLLEVPVMSPRTMKEKLAEVFFERFSVPSFYMYPQPLASLYAVGKMTGLVVDCGDGLTQVMPVYSGYPIMHAINRVGLGGSDINDYLATLLNERGYSFTTSAEMEIVRDIKERICYVALDYEEEMKKAEEEPPQMEYVLPDSSLLVADVERFMAPEILFNPGMVGLDAIPVHEAVLRSLLRSPIDTRPELASNIVLSGGSTLFPGFKERLRKEVVEGLREEGLKELDVKITAVPERLYTSWMGGAILANLESFRRAWITIQDYRAEGPSVVGRCL